MSRMKRRAPWQAYQVVWGAALLASAAVAQAQPARPDKPTDEGGRGAGDPAGEALPWEAGGDADALTTSAEPAATGEPAEAPASEPEGAGHGDGASSWTDQGIGVGVGIAVGGRLTPGGLRLTGNYLYRLSANDWFDGAAAFTLGSQAAECYRDRVDQRVCDHGALDGFAADFAFTVRRGWPAKNSFAPFARVGAAVRFVRFSGDQVAGLAIPLIGGGGVTVELSETTRLAASGQLEVGGGLFSRGLGTGPQLGMSVGAGIEFSLR
jgi:hypothetical protein